MAYKLVKATDDWMTRPRFGLPRGRHFYPSESSVQWVDEYGITRTEGACLRKAYYRLSGEYTSAKTSAYTEWIFALGKAVEEILVEQWKQMGIWVANNVKFYDPERNISGEIDVIIAEPDGTLVGIEAKSIYGYHGTKQICGNTKQAGAPKTSQLLQTLIYVDLCKKLELIDYFKMVYYARDSASRNEFDISITEENGVKRPTIDGVIDYRFTMDDIYDRYAELSGYLEGKIVPPRDYDICYAPDKVESRYKIGEVSKTAYQKWQKNPTQNPISDWNCNYCPYSKVCWKKEDESS